MLNHVAKQRWTQDERQPQCLRCEKSKRQCLGYEKVFIFIPSPGAGLKSGESSPSTCTTVKCAKESQIHLEPCAGPVSRSHTPLGAFIPLNAFQEDIIISHLLAKLYKSPTSTVEQGPGDTELINVLAYGNRRSAAHVAIMSVGKAFFGRVNNLGRMVTESRSHYLEALHRVQDELSVSCYLDKGSLQWLTVLWCCSFLGMYEMMCSSSSTAWIQHSRGLAALVSVSGGRLLRTIN